jgi:hypothetical protein
MWSPQTGQHLSLVDPSTGAAVATFAIDASASPLAAQAFTLSADGLSEQTGENVALYYTSGNKLYALSLVGPAVDTPRRVSSEAQACQLLKVVPKDATAATSWLLITTQGPDGSCEQSEDNLTKLVSSDAPDSTAALTSPLKLGALLDLRRDAQGKLVQLLGFDADAHELVAVSATDGTVTPVNNGSIGELTSATYLGKVAGIPSQIYVRVGNKIRTVSWATGTPELSVSDLGTLNAADIPFVHTDGSAAYFVDGTDVKAIGHANVASLGAGEVLRGGAMTPSSLAVLQRTETGVALRVVNKTTGTVREVALPVDAGSLSIEAQNGEVLIVSQALSADSTDAKLWRVDLATTGVAAITPTTVAEKARVITTVREATRTTAGESQQTHLVWCDATVACKASTLKSYALVSGNSLALAGASTTSGNWDLTRANLLTTAQGLLTSSTQGASGIWQADSLWLFDAGKAASLSQVSELSVLQPQ